MSARFDYDRMGTGYAQRRRPDPRIERQIAAALGAAASVVNVGAGAGSYEPAERRVVAVEPSLAMTAQRESAAAVVRGVAEALPFAARSFDASMAVLTMHHWSDWRRGVAELRRVARSRVVLLTFDPEAGAGFWLFEYFPEILERDRLHMPPLEALCEAAGGPAELVAIPRDCSDGFLASRWGDPADYLDPQFRGPISGFRMLEPAELRRGMSRLARDLEDGSWLRRHGELLDRESLDCGYRLVVGEVGEAS